MKIKIKKNTHVFGTMLKEGYDAKVGHEAIKRVGRNINLKGIIHEIRFKDSFNFNPKNILTGSRAYLTKSTTSVRDDIVIKRAQHVIKRFQLKDTPASIQKTMKQVLDGKYARTTLIGTKETQKAYYGEVAKKTAKGAGVPKEMGSSRVSSLDTECVANKMLGKLPSAKMLGSAFKSAFLIGAMFSAGTEAVSSYKDFKNSKITGSEYTGKIAYEFAGGGISAGTGTVIATLTTAVAATVGALATAPAWVPALIGIGAGTVTGITVKKGYDLLFAKGKTYIMNKLQLNNQRGAEPLQA